MNLAEKEALLVSGENQLKQYGKFSENYSLLLRKLNSDDEEINNFCNLSKVPLEQYGPISISYDPIHESISLFQLVESDNKVLNKILIVFAQLCEDAKYLKSKAVIYQTNLLLYDEDFTEVTEDNSQLNLVKLSQMLEFIFNLKYFLQRCLIVSHNIIKQLGALFEQEKYYINIQSSIHFQSVFHRLADVINIFVIFDDILSNSNIFKNWRTYKKTIHSVSQNLDTFGRKNDRKTLSGLENVLGELEDLFIGNWFQNAIDVFSNLKHELNPKAFATFTGHFQSYLRSSLNEITKFSSDLSEFNETIAIIKINAMSVVYHNIFGNLDQKNFKTLIETNIKHCGVTLIGNLIWCPEIFIKKHAETLLKGYDKYVTDAQKVRQMYLTNKMQSLIKDTQAYCIQISGWILQFTYTLKSGCHNIKMEQIRQRCTLILQGVQFAGQISHIIKSITNLHILLKSPMQKSCLASICKLIEFLKIISLAFSNNTHLIVDSVQSIIQHLEYQILYILANAKKKLSQTTSYSEKNLDILSAIQIVEKSLYGPATSKHILVARLGLSATDPTYTFTSDQLQKIEKTLLRLDLIIELQKNIEHLSNSSFLYWHQSLLPIYLKQVMEQKTDLLKIAYVIYSTTDCGNFLKQINSKEFQCIQNFNEKTIMEMKNEIILKICNHIETYLRLDFHSNLQLEKTNPFDNCSNDYRSLIKMKPIQIVNRQLVMKDYIEHYLSNMFYNLTTVSLHDWRTYGEMRRLAVMKFNLHTVEDHLPTQTLEQGLDVLEIMRNIQVFVSKYLYNLNNQIFVEQTSNNKHLNTINIRHIANSLRTHGTGIINTTVNFTYQFLRKKFYVFSQFMYDEHIKSRLLKDLKFFRDNRDKMNQTYSYDRADAFNKGIRKLGMSPTGQSYLDLFRLVVSHIGNAMGYVRMIRSGGLHSCSNASVYLPCLDENLRFLNMTKGSNLSDVTCKAAENLEYDIKNLSRNYTEGTDYFRLLVDAFASFFRNPKNVHLRNFYLIIPPLTINFIDHILTSKDKMTKKNKDGALFTDDGFAMGLAYILKLLDQTSDFNTLYWFNAVRQKYNREKKELQNQREKLATNDDIKLQQTLSLTEKRINKMQQEYDLLYCNLSSAKIFFQ